MKTGIIGLLLFSILGISQGQEAPGKVIHDIYKTALRNGKAYHWLDYLANEIGGRLAGSPQAAMAVDWSKQVLDTLGLDSVWLQPVIVPHWIRGQKEYAKIISPEYFGEREVNICALGLSIGTGENGITAPVVEVSDFKELQELGPAGIKGKIVFFNTPMNPEYIQTFHAYGSSVKYRWAGASEAAKYGAVGMILRSLSLAHDQYPHTGVMHYSEDSTIQKIPAAAISTLDADVLSSALKEDPGLLFHYKMNCEQLPDVLSYNVIGEIRGTEFPDKIIVVGGHLDAWDNGDGAHDDGAGCMQSIEVLSLFKTLNIQPRHTIRCVLFMNEENGARGGKEYAKVAKENDEYHLAAIESDAGGFTPRGFSVQDTMPVVEQVQAWGKWFQPYDLHRIEKGHGGVDISFLEEIGTTLIGLRPDSQRYFDYHHSPADTFDKVNLRELELGAAAMASMVYLIDVYGILK
jgi:carboxypeptidase Q